MTLIFQSHLVQRKNIDQFCSNIMVVFFESAFLFTYGLTSVKVRDIGVLHSCLNVEIGCLGEKPFVNEKCGNVSVDYGTYNGLVTAEVVPAEVFTLKFIIPSVFVLHDYDHEYLKVGYDGLTTVHSLSDYNDRCIHYDGNTWKPPRKSVVISEKDIQIESFRYKPRGVIGGKRLPSFPVRGEYVTSGLIHRKEFNLPMGTVLSLFGKNIEIGCGLYETVLVRLEIKDDGHYLGAVTSNNVKTSRTFDGLLDCSQVFVVLTEERFEVECVNGAKMVTMCKTYRLDWKLEPLTTKKPEVIGHYSQTELYEGPVVDGGFEHICKYSPMYICQKRVAVYPVRKLLTSCKSSENEDKAPSFITDSSVRSAIGDWIVEIALEVFVTLGEIFFNLLKQLMNTVFKFICALNWSKIIKAIVSLIDTIGTINGIVLAVSLILYSFSSRYFGNVVAPLTVVFGIIVLLCVLYNYLVTYYDHILYFKRVLWDEL
jgi:hypothetical protein